MSDRDEGLEAWEQRLGLAEADLAERERQSLADDPPPEVFAAFAAERDKIALDRDTIADLYEEQAGHRDRSALRRDVAASGRDRRSREAQNDLDPAFTERAWAGIDRDDSAGDRGDSFDDRGRSHTSRARAAADREHAHEDRDRAAARSDEQAREIDGLRAALESRLVIGQAVGLLMARHTMSPDEAFQTLVRLSQHHNVKVRELAAKLVTAAGRAPR